MSLIAAWEALYGRLFTPVPRDLSAAAQEAVERVEQQADQEATWKRYGGKP